MGNSALTDVRTGLFGLVMLASGFALPASAQEAVPEIDFENSVFAGDYLSVGVGVAVNASYKGSDDYVLTPIPVVQGSLGGVDINPRPAGLALDFIPDGDGKVDFDLGVAARLRSDRAKQIEDEVVASLGALDRAIEVGPAVGVKFSEILHPYDSITVSSDVLWDVNGAHGGMVVAPSVTYFTPLSRGVATSLSLSTEYVSEDFADYYFRVTPEQSLASGLPAFEPDGGGFTNVGATLLMGVDLNGNMLDGGLALLAIAGYSRLLGDAADTPFTSVRGSRDQFLGVLGIGYTF